MYMTTQLSIREMFAPLWSAAPAFHEKCVSLSLINRQTGRTTLPYAVLSELAGYLIDCLRNGETDGFQGIFDVVEEWHVHGDHETKTAATVGLVEDLQNLARHDQTVSAHFLRWLLPETSISWQRVEDFWSGEAQAI
jgi:hypothetical protein